ncbi:MAG TPA: YncE family protein [Methylomirabilota bacterium]|nr:YncE family protein [Methylomirabilota bacterium]
MKSRKLWLVLALTCMAVTMGCSSQTTVSITISPTTATVLIAHQEQFTGTVTGSTNTAVNWCVVVTTNGKSSCTAATASTASGNAIVGTVDTTGLYTAPALIPSPNSVTVTATAAANSAATANATVTIASGIGVTVSPSTVTLGSNETFPFTAVVTGTTTAGCAALNLTVAKCTSVTWEVCSVFTSATATTAASCTTTGTLGSIASTTGLYTAPGSVPTNSIIVVATSVADPTVTGIAGVEVIAAVDPTVSSVSPSSAPQGGLFQDIYLTGTHFISTTSVLVNGVVVSTPCTEGNANVTTGCFTLPNSAVSALGNSSTVTSEFTSMQVRLPDFMLSNQPSPPNTTYALSISVERQGGIPQTCPTLSQCQVVVTPVRPAIVGPTPDSTPQGGTSALNFNINGGYFGTATNPTVTALYNNQPRVASITSSTRQLGVTIGGSLNESDFSTPGLYPVTLRNTAQPQLVASTNLAVRPAYGPPAATQSSVGVPATLTLGTQPSAVAINHATGIAVVANQGSNDVTLIDMTQNPPAVVLPSLCTETVGDTGPCGAADANSPKTGPVSVAVDYLLNVALVANGTSDTISVIDLSQRKVTAIIPALNNQGTVLRPISIGINSVTGQGIVVYASTNAAGIICLTQTACPNSPPPFPAITGIVTVATGPNASVAIEPRLNWAVITPGGLGSLTIANLGQKTQDIITAVSRKSGTVTITTSAGGSFNPGLPSTPTALHVNQAVLITGIPDTTDTAANILNGIFTVTSVPSANSYTFTQSGTTTPPDMGCIQNPPASGFLVCGCPPNATSVSSCTGTTATSNSYDNYSSPVATMSVSVSVTGVAINTETQDAVLTDPLSSAASVYILNLLDQTSSAVGLPLGASAAAFNPLTDTALVLNSTQGTAVLVDPTIPSQVPLPSALPTGQSPIAADIDPGTNEAIVINQTDGTATVFSLGALRPLQITDISPRAYSISASLTAPAVATDQTLTIVGQGFVSGSVARMDGIPLQTLSVSPNGREMTVNVPASMISTPHILALDVFNQGSPPAVSNAEDFTVLETVDVTGPNCAQPAPAGVALDQQNNLVVASLSGCNTLAIVNLSTGTGQTVAVGTFPTGVAVMPNLHLAAVANEGSSNVSIVDTLADSVTQTEGTGAGPVGVAVDQNTQEVAVACSLAGSINIFNAVTPGTVASEAVGEYPVSVAIDPLDNLVASANAEGNDVSIVDETGPSLTATVSGMEGPTNVVYDPSEDEFLVSSSQSNQFFALTVLTQQSTPVKVGINPTGIAYNSLSSTLVTANTTSGTMTVVDFLDRRIRGVIDLFGMPCNRAITPTCQFVSPQTTSSQELLPTFSVDVHPLANLAVVADTTNNRLLIVPLPR